MNEQVIIRERPILFSAPMVKAILDGRKTVTRRVVKPQPDDSTPGYWSWLARKGLPVGRVAAEALSPFGQPGDRLWVRETFSSVDVNGHKSSPREAHFVVLPDGTQVCRDGTVLAALPEYARGAFDGITWRPSIHMPRWASRIMLEVVSVRVERLHEITEDDARAEGVDDGPGLGGRLYPGTGAARGPLGHRRVFSLLWEMINGKRAPWASNPWVWRVEFRRVS